MVGGAFFGLTGIVSVAKGVMAAGNTLIREWAGYFLGSAAGCLILLKLYGWHRRPTEAPSKTLMLNGARLFFAVQTSVVGVFGR